MTKMLMLLLMMSLLSVSCNKSGDGTDKEVTKTETIETGNNDDRDNNDDSPAPPISNLPSLALSFKTNVELINFNGTQEDKYNKAIAMVKSVIGTEEFRTKVLNHTYIGSKQFADNGGKTNAQIYQAILDAAEKLKPSKNNTLDLEAELYYENNSVVGYTYASTTQIWVNSKFFNQYEANSVAGNLTHEWLHKLGYGHDSSATAKRPYSVPYAIGYIMRDIGKKFL